MAGSMARAGWLGYCWHSRQGNGEADQLRRTASPLLPTTTAQDAHRATMPTDPVSAPARCPHALRTAHTASCMTDRRPGAGTDPAPGVCLSMCVFSLSVSDPCPGSAHEGRARPPLTPPVEVLAGAGYGCLRRLATRPGCTKTALF